MSEQAEKHSSINWGGLAKGILTGAAIVAGLLLLFPAIAQNLATVFPLEGLSQGVSAITKGMGGFFSIIAGTALVWTGYKHLSAPKTEAPHPHPEVDESFAIKEDMRRTDALMALRMRAQGYEPAMALANQPGR